jgi:hypothetical protein
MNGDISRMTDEQLRAAIGAEVMGVVWDEARCRVCGWRIDDEHCQADNCSLRPFPEKRADELPHYESDDSTVCGVEAGIKARGLIAEYLNELRRIVDPAPITDLWQMVTATSRQRCEAALAAVRRQVALSSDTFDPAESVRIFA